jgi:acyl-CoA hydrolase
MIHHTKNTIHLTDIVFPKDTNHYDTLFGGAAMAYMDKVAFIAATRFGRRGFVTGSCENIDFQAPARKGNIVDFAATVISAGRRSLKVEVIMQAECILTAEKVICTRGIFNMVAVNGAKDDVPLCELEMATNRRGDPNADLRIVELVFADDTNHYGTLFGGHGLSMMAKASFIAASRHSRAVMVLAAVESTDFQTPISEGEIVDLSATVMSVGNSSVKMNVKMWGEGLLGSERQLCADSDFILVAVDKSGNSKKI